LQQAACTRLFVLKLVQNFAISLMNATGLHDT